MDGDICIVVPTYWTRQDGSSRPGDAVYDHPTLLGTEGTLPPLLESLETLPGDDFFLLLIVAVTGDDVAEDAESQVREIAARYKGVRTAIFGRTHMPELLARAAAGGFPDAGECLALRTYPLIRNLQLTVPLALGARAIVALDDDEIVIDEHFLEKAVEPLGTEIDGHRVDGLSGYYKQPDGTIYLSTTPEKAASPNLFDRKAAIMNEATRRLESLSGDVVETPYCFGGNMEFSPELAARVGFDPGITRGEDSDYLINARMEGLNFFLRKDIPVLHCPPEGGSYKDSSLSKLQQDVVRFIYERHKLEVSRQNPELRSVTADELMPYPGEFLSEDIAAQSVTALEMSGFEGDARELVRRAEEGAVARMNRYLEFRTRWPALQEWARSDAGLRSWLSRAVCDR